MIKDFHAWNRFGIFRYFGPKIIHRNEGGWGCWWSKIEILVFS